MTEVKNRKLNSDGQALESLYKNVKEVIEDARATFYRAANFGMVQSYWKIGELIVNEEQKGKDRAEYGKELIKKLATRLSKSYGKGYTETNLKYMRLFYSHFPIRHALRGELTWTHYRLLLKVENDAGKSFYIDESIKCNWSTRTLERQIDSHYYERLLMSSAQQKPLVKQEAEDHKEELQARDFIKDPYVLEFLDLKPNPGFYEHELEQAIINKLQQFLLELGKGFCFVGRQYRISMEDENFYADLVFYNYILKCFLIVDLKRGRLSHQDIGQMDMYVRYFEDQVRQSNDNPTIGLILCAEKNKALAKYSLLNDSKQIFASKYQTCLPTVEQLQEEIDQEIRFVESQNEMKGRLC